MSRDTQAFGTSYPEYPVSVQAISPGKLQVSPPDMLLSLLWGRKSGRTLSMPKLKLLWWPHAKKHRYIIISQRES